MDRPGVVVGKTFEATLRGSDVSADAGHVVGFLPDGEVVGELDHEDSEPCRSFVIGNPVGTVVIQIGAVDDRADVLEPFFAASEAEVLVETHVPLADVQLEGYDSIEPFIGSQILLINDLFTRQQVDVFGMVVHEVGGTPLRLGAVEDAEAEDNGHENGREETGKNALHDGNLSGFWEMK